MQLNWQRLNSKDTRVIHNCANDLWHKVKLSGTVSACLQSDIKTTYKLQGMFTVLIFRVTLGWTAATSCYVSQLSRWNLYFDFPKQIIIICMLCFLADIVIKQQWWKWLESALRWRTPIRESGDEWREPPNQHLTTSYYHINTKPGTFAPSLISNWSGSDPMWWRRAHSSQRHLGGDRWAHTHPEYNYIGFHIFIIIWGCGELGQIDQRGLAPIRP